MKKNGGITLIALVITITVLLILAGVAISMLSGENGILRKAADAKTKTEEAKKDEAATLTDYDIESHFILNNSKYKCRNGFITGVTVEEVEGENGNKELKTTDTVEDLQKELPDGYIVATKYTEAAKDEPVDKDENLKTGMAITKGNEEVARVVIYGDFFCDGKVLADASATAGYCGASIGGSERPEFLIQSLNVVHDSYIDQRDVDFMNKYDINKDTDGILKNQSVYAIKIKNPKKISDREIINSMEICEIDDFEKMYYEEESEEYYYSINLNKEYTYKEMYSIIEKNFPGCTMSNNKSNNKIESGANIIIGIPLLVNNDAIPENASIQLKIQ